MNEKTATEVSNRLWKIHGDLNDLLWFLKANCDEQEFLRLRKEIASIMGTIDLEILVPIYRQYPHLEPSGPDAGVSNEQDPRK